MKKKVLFVASVERHIRAFHIPYIKYFLEKGIEVHVAACKESDDFMLEDLGVIFHHIDFSRSPYSLDTFKAYRQLKSLLKYNHYDIIHTHTPVASFLVRLAARNSVNTKMLYTAHGFHFYNGAPFLNWFVYYPIELLAARFTDGLITINMQDYRRAQKFKYRNNGQAYYVHGVGVDIENYGIKDEVLRKEYRDEMAISEDTFVLICIAELSDRKNQMQLIQAIEKINDKNLLLLLVGEGENENKIREAIYEKNLEKKVRLLGQREDIPQLLNMSDCITLVSHHEGLARAVLEGMAAGLVGLGTNVRGIRDLIIHKKTGYIVPVGDINATRQSIRRLTYKGEGYRRMSINASKRIRKYDLKNVMTEMDKIYRRFLDK